MKMPTVSAAAMSRFLSDHISRISADTLGWLAAVVLHCATIPTLLALMTGLSDQIGRAHV